MTEQIEVLITLDFDDDLVAKLQDVSPRFNLTLLPANKVEEISDDVWQRTEVLYTHHVLPHPEQVPNLRWLQFHWAGIDHAVQAPLLAEPELLITTLSGAAVSQISEYVLMMLLALGHRMPEMISMQKQAKWPHKRWESFSPSELRGSVVGIVGYGSIGRQIARLLYVFGARVLATKRDVMHPEDSGYTPAGMGDPQGDFVHRLYPPQAIVSMLRECDFVVITVPLTPETSRMISAKELAAMKPTAFLVDVSRGGVVEHGALIDALVEQRIAGAALDVFPEEPLPAESPLWKLSNVLLSPHISGYASVYERRAVKLFCENLHRYLVGDNLLNLYDVQLGY